MGELGFQAGFHFFFATSIFCLKKEVIYNNPAPLSVTGNFLKKPEVQQTVAVTRPVAGSRISARLVLQVGTICRALKGHSKYRAIQNTVHPELYCSE